MKARHLTLLFTATLCLALSGCDGSDKGNAIDDLCNSTCTTGHSLSCPAEAGLTVADCASACNDISQLHPSCDAQFEAYLACADSVPAANWVCDANEESNLGVGFCETEYAAMDTCVTTN